MAIKSRLRKYGAFISLAARQAITNKTVLCGGIFLLLILLLTYNQLWTVIGKDSADPSINATFLWYLLFGELIILSAPKVERILEQDIKSGTLAYYLNKPVSFFMMRFCENLSLMSINFVSLGLAGTLTAWLLTPQTPFTWLQFPLIVSLVYLSSLINLLLYTAVGFSSLWLEHTKTLAMAVQRLAFIFGGAIFPLSIYPEWFVNIARWTPFYSLYYLTIKLSYDFSAADVSRALGLNCLWLAFIIGFIIWAYRTMQKRVNVYGG